MPPEYKELSIVIDSLVKQVQMCLESLETFRTYVTNQLEIMRAANSEYVVAREKMKDMEKDMEDVKKQLEDVKQAILQNQEKRFARTIALQSTILLLLLGPALSYLVPLVIQLFFHR